MNIMTLAALTDSWWYYIIMLGLVIVLLIVLKVVRGRQT